MGKGLIPKSDMMEDKDVLHRRQGEVYRDVIREDDDKNGWLEVTAHFGRKHASISISPAQTAVFAAFSHLLLVLRWNSNSGKVLRRISVLTVR